MLNGFLVLDMPLGSGSQLSDTQVNGNLHINGNFILGDPASVKTERMNNNTLITAVGMFSATNFTNGTELLSVDLTPGTWVISINLLWTGTYTSTAWFGPEFWMENGSAVLPESYLYTWEHVIDNNDPTLMHSDFVLNVTTPQTLTLRGIYKYFGVNDSIFVRGNSVSGSQVTAIRIR